jgi:hypothetical protein
MRTLPAQKYVCMPLTLSTYGHVIEELDGAPQMDAEMAIQAAGSASAAHQRSIESPGAYA